MFAHDAAYFDSKDLEKRAIPDRIFKDRAYEIYINPKYEENRNKYKLRASSRIK